jgi:transposase
MYEYPIRIIVVWKELNTSGGVVKHPKNIKEEYFKRNLTLLGEWLSILFKRKLFGKELNTSGGVVKHPKNIKEEYFKRNSTLPGEWLSILKISKRNTSNRT